MVVLFFVRLFFLKVELNFTLFLSTKFNMHQTNYYNWYWKAASFVCGGLLRLKQVLPHLKVGCRTLLHPQNVDSCAPPRHFLGTAPESTHCLCNAPRPATHGLSFCQNVPCPMLLPHHYKERRECRKAVFEKYFNPCVLTDKSTHLRLIWRNGRPHTRLHSNGKTVASSTRVPYRIVCGDFSLAYYAYLCGTWICAGTMSLILFLTTRCFLLPVPLSVRERNTSHTSGVRQPQTHRLFLL